MPTYADNAWHGPVTIVENVRLAEDTYRVRFACPEIARRVVPGQFVMLRLAGGNDPLLGRPLAVYDVSGAEGDSPHLPERPEGCFAQMGTVPFFPQPHFIDIVYLLVGKMTHRLADFQPGAQLEAWGPLGNGFPPEPAEHLVAVAGGIGQTPFLILAREFLGLQSFGDPARQAPRARRVTLCYGVKSKKYFAGVEDFRRAGVEVHLSTDDGTEGHHGLVTELIGPVVEQSPWPCRIVCCGPEPMMSAVSKISQALDVPCQVSLESPMACGIGICFSCVKKIRDASGAWDYRRTCVEGPVFEGADVEF